MLKPKPKIPTRSLFLPSCPLPLGAETLLLLPTCAARHSGQLGHSLVSRAAGLALSCPISPGLLEASGETAQLARTVQAAGVSPHRLTRGCHLRREGARPTTSAQSRLFSAQQGREIKFFPSVALIFGRGISLVFSGQETQS